MFALTRIIKYLSSGYMDTLKIFKKALNDLKMTKALENVKKKIKKH